MRLAAVQADATLFHGLLGGRDTFESIIPHDSLTTPDLVEMAARVKRAIEREAALVEDRAKTLRAEARAHSSIAESLDLTLPHDATLLQNELEDALREDAAEKEHLNQLILDQTMKKAKRQDAAEARAKLEAFQAGPTVAECLVKLASAEKLQETWDVEVRRLADELDAATRHANRCAELTHQARNACEQAKREEELYSALHQAVDAGAVPEVSQIDINDQLEAVEITSENVRKARAALEMGVRIRDALLSQQRAESTNHAASKLEVDAVRLRDAAADTATVLTNAIATIPNCPLRVRFNDTGDPVLVCATERSATEPFEELSDGEKWLTVVQIAAAGNRLIVLPQAAFGELSDSSRDMIDGLARANDCYILTALAEDCELRAEAWRRS